MKIKYFLFALTILVATACSNNKDLTGCYANRDSKDSVKMKIEGKDDKYTGELDIAIDEKDKNTGFFEGTLEDGILLIKYSFQSEGTYSVREMAFKVKGDKLLEGYGEMEEKNGMMSFIHPEKLEYGKGIVITKNPCD